jgi:alpha-tubulin suppressor-like RCC1 family protein
VKVLSGATNITAGLFYTCATMLNGDVMCWGDNENGQLADGGQVDQAVPTLANLVSGISDIDAGMDKSCGLTESGLVRCLIDGSSQELGNLPAGNLDVAVNRFSAKSIALNSQGTPVEYSYGQLKWIEQLSDILDVDSGLSHTCALQNTGNVYCWGSNYYGQLGINSTTRSTDPALVANLSNAWQLAVGKYHACAMVPSEDLDDPGILCWGLNGDGQLGDGNYETRLAPVEVK